MISSLITRLAVAVSLAEERPSYACGAITQQIPRANLRSATIGLTGRISLIKDKDHFGWRGQLK